MFASQAALLRLHLRGYAVMKGVLDPAELQPVVNAARAHLSDVEERIVSRGFDDIRPSLRFARQTLAADLVAIDPATAHEPNEGQIERTLLWRAIMSSELQLVVHALAPQPSWELARVRIIIPDNDQPGALPMHREKDVCQRPGAFNLWTPFVNGVGTETPGLAFRRGPKGKMRCPAPLNIGDVIVFDGEIFHGTDLSRGAKKPRIGFDIRLFPTPDEIVSGPGQGTISIATRAR